MKKLFFLLLPLLAAAWLASLGGCGKDPKTTITVQEYGTHTPIPDATVTLGDCDSDPSSGNVNCTGQLTGLTDEKGEFKTDTKAFAAAASAEGYWKSGDDFIVIGVPSGVSQIRNLIYLYPQAWIEVTVKNESGAYMISVPGDWPIGADKHVSISMGQQETFKILNRGNIDNVYVFSIQDTPGHILSDFSNVEVILENGHVVSVTNDNTADWFKIYLKGHETTKITITY